MQKKNIPYALLVTRAIFFTPIILSTFNMIDFSLAGQIIAATIVMTSDIFDGKISRKYNNEKDKLRFRLMDTIVDKTGIFLCLAGLLKTSQIPIHYAFLIISYNALLLGGGLVNLIKTKNKKEETVQGLSISRWFTALTGVSIILLNNVKLSSTLEYLLTIAMANIAVSSLTIQLKDKIKQKDREDQSLNNDEVDYEKPLYYRKHDYRKSLQKEKTKKSNISTSKRMRMNNFDDINKYIFEKKQEENKEEVNSYAPTGEYEYKEEQENSVSFQRTKKRRF